VPAARNGQSYAGLRRRCHEWMSKTESCCSAWRGRWHVAARAVTRSGRCVPVYIGPGEKPNTEFQTARFQGGQDE
jgi:hypothetical protein